MIFRMKANPVDLKAVLKEQPVKHYVRSWPTSTRVMFVKTTKQDALDALEHLNNAGFCNCVGRSLEASDLSSSIPGTFTGFIYKCVEAIRGA